MELIEVQENQIIFNINWLESNFIKLFYSSDYNLILILELLEMLRDLKQSDQIGILKDHYLFNEFKQLILNMEC